MEITLEQALRKGVEAHKAGKIQEADRYYTAILKTNPKHPDANHNMGVLAVGIGKVEQALPFFKTALEVNPSLAQYWLSYLDALIKLDRMSDAKAVLDQAKSKGAQGDGFDQIEKKLGSSSSKGSKAPDPPKEKLKSLISLYTQGHHQQALMQASQLLEQFPKSINLYNIIGAVNKDLGKLEEAVEAYTKAISLKPDFADANYNMGVVLQEQGKLDEAIEAYKKALSIKPQYPEAYYNMGNALKKQGKLDEAIEAYTKAISIKPDYAKAKMNLSVAKNLAIPAWHITMMNDLVRNNAYLDALKLAITNKDLVLEIGTGSGLLAMMSAKAGAKEVITCEASRTIATAAEEIIAENSYEKKIKVVNKKSTDLIIGEDLPNKADIIVSEILSSEFVGEGVQATIVDANKRLLKKNGKMLPESGAIKIALIGDNEEINEKVYVKEINGFDFSKFNSKTGQKFPLNLKTKPNLLSKTEVAFKFELCGLKIPSRKEKILILKANKSGLCYGIIQWLSIQIFKNVKYENKPGDTPSHWSTPIYCFDEPINVTKGQEIKVKATLLEDKVWFSPQL